MSIVAEMNGKAGRVCPRSYRGGNGCPLVIRPTSEDVLVGNTFGILRRLRPELWLRPMLTAAFPASRFGTCSMRGLDVAFWQSLRPPTVRRTVESASEPDMVIRFGNTVVVVEAKFMAGVATRTARDPHRDQVARLLDVAFEETRGEQLFRREPYVLLLGTWETEPLLVTRYRDPSCLAEALAHHSRFPDHRSVVRLLSRRLGYVSWVRLAELVRQAAASANALERAFLLDVADYLAFKLQPGEQASGEGRQRSLWEHQTRASRPRGDRARGDAATSALTCSPEC